MFFPFRVSKFCFCDEIADIVQKHYYIDGNKFLDNLK